MVMTAAQAAAGDAALHGELALVAGERVFFAHNSVGTNVMHGLAALAGPQGMQIRFDELLVPENGDPQLKLRNFERAVQERAGKIDVAILKFCYTDIGSDTNAAALFEQYRATLRRLQARYPRITFVHVTVPLTTVQTGFKAVAKRLLGRQPYGTVENVRREEYNALLRSAYLGREPLFDLARVESVDPKGHPVDVHWQGKIAPALASQYTVDGGHLNAEGSERAARELVKVLAAVARNRAPLQAASR